MTPMLPAALQSNASDRAVSGLRALTDLVNAVAPGWGSLFGELVGHVIPNLREDRIADYLTQVARRTRLNTLGINELSARLELVEGSQERLALLEEGARAAAGSTEAARICQIAELVAFGLSEGEVEAARNRRLLRLLNDLDELDLEALRLIAKRCAEGRQGQPFEVGNETELLSDPRGQDVRESERYAAYQITSARLESRRLVWLPDHTGLEKAYPTTLGELLLSQIDLHPDSSRLFSLSASN